jgi:hypothetical protein
MITNDPRTGMVPRRDRLKGAAVALLTHRRLPWLVALLGVVLSLPALGVGLAMDDYYHRVVLLEMPEFRELLGPPGDMFRFFRGDPARTLREMDAGFFPWWTDPEIKGEFLQALTVLTHRLDYRLWPDSIALMHLHNLLWYGALIAAAALLYRRIMGPTVTAGVAALLFAIDDAHGTPVGWIANRNSLVAATFGVSAVIAHDAWRRGRSRVGMVIAPALFAAALFSKEEGIAGFAYLLAYALAFDPAGWRRGGLAVLPYVGMILVWRTLRDRWGYGVANVGLYIDPLDEPVRFVLAALGRAPILLLGQWGAPPSDLAVLLGPWGRAILLAVALLFLAWLIAAIVPLLRTDRTARFWALGMTFAAIPLSAIEPMDRLLTAVGPGAFGLLALFWAAVFNPEHRPEAAGWRRMALPLARLLIVIHLVIAPLALPLRAGNPIGPRPIERSWYVNAPLGPEIRGRTVAVVNARSPAHAGYLMLQRAAWGMPIPRHIRVLAPAMPAVTIRRPDDRTLVVRPEGGYLRWPLDRVFRSERREMALGHRVSLTGMTAEVTEVTPDGRPAEVAFHFDVPLEDDSLIWLCDRGGIFEPFTPPAMGQAVTIEVGGLWPRPRQEGGPGRP